MWVKIEMRHMKETSSTLLRYISKKGQHVSKGVLFESKLELIFIGLTSIPSSLLPDYELEIIFIA